MDDQKKDSLRIQGSYPIIRRYLSWGQRPSCIPAASNQYQSLNSATGPGTLHSDIFITDEFGQARTRKTQSINIRVRQNRPKREISIFYRTNWMTSAVLWRHSEIINRLYKSDWSSWDCNLHGLRLRLQCRTVSPPSSPPPAVRTVDVDRLTNCFLASLGLSRANQCQGFHLDQVRSGEIIL